MKHSSVRTMVHSLPLSNELRISETGAIFSRQQLTLPTDWLPPDFVVTDAHLRELGPFYFRRLPALTRGLVQVEATDSRVTFRLALLRVPLLRFAAPTLTRSDGGGDLTYPIVGGWALARGAPSTGVLAMHLHRTAAGVAIGMTVREYHSQLLGHGTIWPVRRWLYTRTQARAHQWIAFDFVRQVALALHAGTVHTLKKGP